MLLCGFADVVLSVRRWRDSVYREVFNVGGGGFCRSGVCLLVSAWHEDVPFGVRLTLRSCSRISFCPQRRLVDPKACTRLASRFDGVWCCGSEQQGVDLESLFAPGGAVSRG